jgi:hypothetical protein
MAFLNQDSRRPYRNIKTVHVYYRGDTVGKTSFKQFITVPFDIDEVVLQTYTAYDYDLYQPPAPPPINPGDPANPLPPIKLRSEDHYMIYTDLFPGGSMQPIATHHLTDTQRAVFHSRFQMEGTPLIREVNFQYRNIDGSVVDNEATFVVSCVLELLFIQY